MFTVPALTFHVPVEKPASLLMARVPEPIFVSEPLAPSAIWAALTVTVLLLESIVAPEPLVPVMLVVMPLVARFSPPVAFNVPPEKV